MKLLFIYGPPAAGKYTVASEVAARTGYKLFHNHLTVDAILPVFDFGTDSFWNLIEMIRVETIKEAAKKDVSLIYTFCYAKGEDDGHIENVLEAVESNGGEVCFVLLYCDREELNKRVSDESRQKFEKVKTTEGLHEILGRYDLFSPVPQRASLVIDNTELSAVKTADKIITHFDLRTSS
jgi:RNase adaptor protein for sRNA GlmZ degradation